MKRLLCAAGFLTVVPAGREKAPDALLLSRSIAFFSLVGGLLGAVLALLAYLLHGIMSPLPAAALTVCAWTVLTGGLHLDGLADTVDGFGGGGTLKRRLEIMKDSRIGTFGAAAVCLALILKTAFAAELIGKGLYTALIVAPATGRAVMALAVPLFPSARKSGIGHTFKRNSRVRDSVIAAAAAAAIALILQGAWGLFAALTAGGLGLLAALGISRGLGGLTGDVYGALCECSEIAVLLLLLVVPGSA
jgi:adenosylcobinamide-GDP ribazoletransferase